MRHASFEIEMLEAKVTVIIGGSKKQVTDLAQEVLGGELEDTESFHEHGAMAAVNGRLGLIYLGEDSTINAVYHEAYHVTTRLIRYIRLSHKSEEWNAHLYAYITEQAVKIWSRGRKRK